MSSSQSLNGIPFEWYFSEAIYQREQEIIFKSAPEYIGHELMVKNTGDYFVLERLQNAKMLMRNHKGVQLISNLCRHHQAQMLDGSGNVDKIICPVHRWTYDTHGKLQKAPHFPENPCLNLDVNDLKNWRGLLFLSKQELENDFTKDDATKYLDFANYRFGGISAQNYNFNWKIFIEVYIDNYHVEPFHRGLRDLVNMKDLRWDIGKNHSAQIVGVSPNLQRAGTENYQKWQDLMLSYNHGQAPEYGAIWFLYYPNIMIEHYPYMLAISTIIPEGPEQCKNIVEFYYPQDIFSDHPDFIIASQKAYNETAVEDEEICHRMHQGRKSLYLQQQQEVSPFHPLMEQGMPYFHQFLYEKLGST